MYLHTWVCIHTFFRNWLCFPAIRKGKLAQNVLECLSTKLFHLNNWTPSPNLISFVILFSFTVAYLFGCVRNNAPMYFIDRKVCIFGAQRYVKGMFNGANWVCNGYVFSQNRWVLNTWYPENSKLGAAKSKV